MEFLQTELEVTLPLQTCAVVVRNTKHQVKMSSYLEIDITKLGKATSKYLHMFLNCPIFRQHLFLQIQIKAQAGEGKVDLLFL